MVHDILHESWNIIRMHVHNGLFTFFKSDRSLVDGVRLLVHIVCHGVKPVRGETHVEGASQHRGTLPVCDAGFRRFCVAQLDHVVGLVRCYAGAIRLPVLIIPLSRLGRQRRLPTIELDLALNDGFLLAVGLLVLAHQYQMLHPFLVLVLRVLAEELFPLRLILREECRVDLHFGPARQHNDALGCRGR